MLDIEYDTRMFLFSRWVTVNYSSDILNKECGMWWKEQIVYFNEKVLPEYVKNGTFYNARHFMSTTYKKYIKKDPFRSFGFSVCFYTCHSKI